MPPALAPHYRRRAKQVSAKTAVKRGDAVFKWYDLVEPTCRIPQATRAKAAAASQDFATNLAADVAGFIILHQCSASVSFLLISTWRGNNELWQSVLYRDAPQDGFAAFDPAYPPPAALRPTFCVWELGIVAHETQAWQHYLRSDRLAQDFSRWQADQLSGTV